MINYFNFKKLNNKYLLTNDLGRYMFTNFDQLKSMITNNVDFNSDFGRKATENFFCYNGSAQAFSELLKPYYRDSKNYLFSATSLHIFVVTNACNMKCVYCQAQSGKCIPNGMMSESTAQKAVDIALSSPGKYLSFEFQGGEPLINFDVIKYIVEYILLLPFYFCLLYPHSNLCAKNSSSHTYILSLHVCQKSSNCFYP